MVAHRSQLLAVPAELSDEAAVLIEPMACAVHAARAITTADIAFVGAGALGLLALAATRALHPDARIVITAKYTEQRAFAAALGADRVVAPDELVRTLRSTTGSFMVGDHLTGGIGTIVDCVGSEASLTDALRVVAPGGTVLVDRKSVV